MCTGSQHQRIRRSNGGTKVVYLYTDPQVKTFQGHLLQVPDIIDEFWPVGITHKYAENCKTWLTVKSDSSSFFFFLVSLFLGGGGGGGCERNCYCQCVCNF